MTSAKHPTSKYASTRGNPPMPYLLNLQDLTKQWPLSQSGLTLSQSGLHFGSGYQNLAQHGSFAAIGFPNLAKRRRADTEADERKLYDGRRDEGSVISNRRVLPKLDIQRVIARVQQNLHRHLVGVRKQFTKYQQGFKQHRDSKRAAKKDHSKQKQSSVNQSRPHKKYGAQVDDLMARALAFERQLDVRSSIKCYEAILEVMPHSYEHLALCSKAWSDATYLDEIHTSRFLEPLSTQDKKDVNLKAKQYAEKALALSHKDCLPEVAACVSIGRLALFSDNKAKVALAKEAREHAIVAIDKQPESDLAHHLMGRWHWEMAQLNVVARTLIRIAFGTALPSGSHADALLSYATACKLAPHRLIHKVELGRAYHKLGKREAAWGVLEAAILLDQEDINAHLQKIDADILLRGLRQDAKRYGWQSDANKEDPLDMKKSDP